MAVRATSSRVVRTDFQDDVFDYDWINTGWRRAGPEDKGDKRPKPRKTTSEMPVTSCAVCGGSENEDQVLLCDGEDCSNEIHLYCLQPPMTTIPEGEWFCPECDETGNTTALQEYLESHYDERQAHQGSKYMKWLYKMHKSFTADRQMHEKLKDMEEFLATSPSEFDPADPELVCKPVRLYCPTDLQYHHGRIIGRKQDESGTWEHLIQFKCGINNRGSGLLAWLTLAEHAISVGMKLYWGKVQGFSYWPGQEYMRSSMELVAHGEKSRNRHKFLVFFGDATHAYLRCDVIFDFVESLTDFANAATTKQLQVSIVLAEAELEEQLAVARARDAFGYDYLEEEGALANTTTLKDLKVAIDYPVQDEIIFIQKKTMPLGLQGYEPSPLQLDLSYLMPPTYHHTLPRYTSEDVGKQPERQLGHVEIDPRTQRSRGADHTADGEPVFGDVALFGFQSLGWFGDDEDIPSEPESDLAPQEIASMVLDRLRKPEKPVELGNTRRRRGRPPKPAEGELEGNSERQAAVDGLNARKRSRVNPHNEDVTNSRLPAPAERDQNDSDGGSQTSEREDANGHAIGNGEEDADEEVEESANGSENQDPGDSDSDEVDEELAVVQTNAKDVQKHSQRLSSTRTEPLLKVELLLEKEDMFEGEEDEDLELLQRQTFDDSDSEETNSPLPLPGTASGHDGDQPSQEVEEDDDEGNSADAADEGEEEEDDDEEYDEPLPGPVLHNSNQPTAKTTPKNSRIMSESKRGNKRQRSQEAPVVRERELFHEIAAMCSAQPRSPIERYNKSSVLSTTRKPKLLGSDSGTKIHRSSGPPGHGTARVSAHPGQQKQPPTQSSPGATPNATLDAILAQFKETIKSDLSPVAAQANRPKQIATSPLTPSSPEARPPHQSQQRNYPPAPKINPVYHRRDDVSVPSSSSSKQTRHARPSGAAPNNRRRFNTTSALQSLQSDRAHHSFHGRRPNHQMGHRQQSQSR